MKSPYYIEGETSIWLSAPVRPEVGWLVGRPVRIS